VGTIVVLSFSVTRLVSLVEVEGYSDTKLFKVVISSITVVVSLGSSLDRGVVWCWIKVIDESDSDTDLTTDTTTPQSS